MAAIVVQDGNKIAVNLEAAQQVASFVVNNSSWIRFLWNYSFILLPLFICTSTLLFRLLWCILVASCGVSRRLCNVVTLFVFFSFILLGSLLFVGLYPVLANEA